VAKVRQRALWARTRGVSNEPDHNPEATAALPHPLVRTPAEWKSALVALGERPFRALQVFQWIHRRSVQEASAMTDLPASLRGKLAESGLAPVITVESVLRSTDDTRKLLVRLADQKTVETVLIPAVSGPGSPARSALDPNAFYGSRDDDEGADAQASIGALAQEAIAMIQEQSDEPPPPPEVRPGGRGPEGGRGPRPGGGREQGGQGDRRGARRR